MKYSVPNLIDHLERVRPVLRAGRCGILVDFDGTISEIALRPDEAEVSRKAAESLRTLAHVLDLVCVMSGRAVHDLQDKIGLDGLTYVGSHGVEYLESGRLWVAPGVAEHREKIGRVFDHLKSTVAVTGLVWDDKYYSASVHYRRAQDPDDARRVLQTAVDAAPGADQLEVFWGKMVLEIRAPVGIHKGFAVRKLVRERRLDGAIVIGDDTTDLDALNALTALRAAGDVRGFGVAVLHEDSPEELVKAADYGLHGIAEVEVFLRWLEDAAE